MFESTKFFKSSSSDLMILISDYLALKLQNIELISWILIQDRLFGFELGELFWWSNNFPCQQFVINN